MGIRATKFWAGPRSVCVRPARVLPKGQPLFPGLDVEDYTHAGLSCVDVCEHLNSPFPEL